MVVASSVYDLWQPLGSWRCLRSGERLDGDILLGFERDCGRASQTVGGSFEMCDVQICKIDLQESIESSGITTLVQGR